MRVFTFHLVSASLICTVFSAAVALADTATDLYDNYCAACHNLGVAGAPRLSDPDAWKSRVEQGNTVLYEHAINGFTGESGSSMPPKGGFVDLTDEQIKIIVEYMVSRVK